MAEEVKKESFQDQVEQALTDYEDKNLTFFNERLQHAQSWVLQGIACGLVQMNIDLGEVDQRILHAIAEEISVGRVEAEYIPGNPCISAKVC